MSGGLSFNIRADNFTQLLADVAKLRFIVRQAFRDPRIRTYLVRVTKDRFAPLGSNIRAQTSPNGERWAAPSYWTVITRKRNTSGYTQSLVDTGTLRRAITIIETRLSDLAFDTGRAGIRVGIPTNSPAYKYGEILRHGGITPNGRVIPAREWLGVGPLELAYTTRIMQNYIDSYVYRGP